MCNSPLGTSSGGVDDDGGDDELDGGVTVFL